ncbi:class I SAM-dependent methyltransferase [Microlunatus speluncae]|uniref:class I SAM-dependent methyltransferase n=1 Tax=Microlunatus speluncae TaxID=2594267 RepID=UPI00126636D9|nr:class I SAM-dependent methyltransferase [Microlunatus speluncae]
MASHHDFDAVYSGDEPAPWQIGGPQPALVEALDRVAVADPVLDVGCGTGELAIFVAERGHRVVGVDLSAPGIDRARARIAGRDLDLTFEVADATRLVDLDLRPRTVLDSGLLHSLDETGQRAYVEGLRAICDPGAVVCVLAVSAAAGMNWTLTPDRLVELFPEPDWTDTSIRSTEVVAGADHHLRLPALLTVTRRAGADRT